MIEKIFDFFTYEDPQDQKFPPKNHPKLSAKLDRISWSHISWTS